MRKILLILGLTALFTALAVKPSWLYILKYEDDAALRLQAVELACIDSISFTRNDPDDSLSYNMMKVALRGGDSLMVDMNDCDDYTLGVNVPTIEIITDSFVNEISSKTDYLDGTFVMRGFGRYDDIDSVSVKIRGRGNTSWMEDKKPYRLKFDKKISLCGLTKAKNYVLIANHIDNTLMKNAVAFEMARMLGLPYTNHSIPVNVTLNGIYKGAYMLSEKIGINSASVDIDEQSGILWEMDKNYDEDYKFRSSYYYQPVMVKDPDPEDLELPEGTTVSQWFISWRSDFNAMERNVRNDLYYESIDEAELVDYMLVNLLACNCELNWPKSTNLYKEAADSLYKFGPVWDYDWAFNYTYPIDRPLLIIGVSGYPGGNFFGRIVRNERFVALLRERFEYFRSDLYPLLLDFIYEYSNVLRPSAYQNGTIWSSGAPTYTAKSTENFDQNVDSLVKWIDGRIRAIDQHPNMLLY